MRTEFSSSCFSLTPGFSPVTKRRQWGKPFQRFFRAAKPLKRLNQPPSCDTRLNPGVPETQIQNP